MTHLSRGKTSSTSSVQRKSRYLVKFGSQSENWKTNNGEVAIRHGCWSQCWSSSFLLCILLGGDSISHQTQVESLKKEKDDVHQKQFGWIVRCHRSQFRFVLIWRTKMPQSVSQPSVKELVTMVAGTPPSSLTTITKN